MPKINTAGHYTIFRGVTIVSALQQKVNDAWTLLYQQLQKNSVLQQYYSLLPPASYHMTLINLATEEDIGKKKWPIFMADNQLRFQALHQTLMNLDFNPFITIKRIDINRTIKLVLDLPEQNKEVISALAQAFGLLHHIPKPFHITLGHQYQPVASPLDQTLQSMLHETMATSNLMACRVSPPKLCYFVDMQAFIPWDGSYNPFQP